MEQRTDPTTTRRPAPAGLLALLVVGLGLLTAGCGSSSDAATAAGVDVGTPRHGGTVWMETAQEPPVLNSFLGAGGMSITEVVTAPLKSTWIQVDDHGVWQPLLATSVPTLANGGVVRTPSGGVQLAFDIQPAAVWSDREPITCQDLRFTWRTVMNPKWAIGSRIGWERIQRIDCPTPKRVRMVLDRPYAPYLSALLATAPLPQHALQGRDFNSVWNNRITVSSGPFVFDRWERGDRITMRRNPNWWRAGPEQKPYVDRLVVRFVADTASLKLDLRMGDADIVGIPPDTNLAKELKSIPDARFVVLPGAGWENLTFNTGRFPFDDARVRRAVAFAVDRDSLVDVALDHQVPRLDSTLLPYQAPYYRPSFDRYRADHAQVDVRMQAAGWTRP
ncbi:MAG: extracellular solute-binding protein family 5, partial [Thermoleophilia bacterium]|nr:extracellular solute-binding protein family 5 [Thermoleophilia bacterium]